MYVEVFGATQSAMNIVARALRYGMSSNPQPRLGFQPSEVEIARMKGAGVRALSNLSNGNLLPSCAIGESVARHDAVHVVVDPATGEIVARTRICTESGADEAVCLAQDAFVGWRDLLARDRGDILRRWAAAIRSNRADLATILVVEQGKSIASAISEIEYGASFLDWFAAEAERAYGETIPSHKPGAFLNVVQQPLGVAVAITPWNFPSAMVTRKAGAALAAGCTMIVKPAPETPLSALALESLARDAGVPNGVFQVLVGDAPKLTARLLSRPEVRAVSFTGSTEVGRILFRQSASTVKRISMELGGHAPFIVFDDAPLENAVQGCLDAKFATSGQDCLAANRIFVQRSKYEPFVKLFAEATRCLRVGHGLDPDAEIGPMTRLSVAEKCRQQIDDALEKGAALVVGGGSSPLGGNFVAPTVLRDVSDEMLIAREETFGPVAAILPFDDEAEVLRRANSTEMGLVAYVYTTAIDRVMRVSNRLEYGMIGVNTVSITGPPIPFGGWKQSGSGREGSKHGISEYMELKYVCIGNSAA